MNYSTDLPKNRQGRASHPGRIKTWIDGMADPVLRETTWEAEMQTAGIEAYFEEREIARERGYEFSDEQTGQKFMRKLIHKVTPAITRLQEELVDRASTRREIKGTLFMVPAPTMGLLTLNVLVNMTYNAKVEDTGAAYQMMVREVAATVETQAQFQSWIRQSRQLAEEWAKAKGLSKVPKSFADRIIEEGQAKERMFKKRWRDAFTEIEGAPWTTEQLHFCGDALLTTVLAALPDHFEVHNPFIKGRQIKHVRMTDYARAEIEKIDAAIVKHQVVKKPMLVPPQPWKKV